MHVTIAQADWRPFFELELSDHQLSQEYHRGIGAARVKEIMFGRLRDAGQAE
jgi:hypothetical protein